MMYVVHFALPSHSSRVLGGVGLVGGNLTRNTPRIGRGRRMAFSSLFFTFFVVEFLLYSILCS